MYEKRHRMRVAVGQHDAQPGDFDGNARKTIDLASTAASMGASFILLPEMNISGYEVEMDWRPLAIPADHPALGRIAQAAADLNIAIAAGFIETWEKGYSINHTVFRTDGSRPFQRKSGGPGATEEGCVSDLTRTAIELGDVRLGIIICADGGHPTLWDQLSDHKVDLIAWPTAGSDWWCQTVADADPTAWDRTALNASHARRNCQARAVAMGTPLMVCNLAGRTPHVAWAGNSGIIDADGAILAWLPDEAIAERMKPAVAVADVSLAAR